MEPLQSTHGNYDFKTRESRITGRRFLTGYAYPQNGNVHNPTPRYTWLLLVDGNIADHFDKKRDLMDAVREDGYAYLAAYTAHAGSERA